MLFIVLLLPIFLLVGCVQLKSLLHSINQPEYPRIDKYRHLFWAVFFLSGSAIMAYVTAVFSIAAFNQGTSA